MFIAMTADNKPIRYIEIDDVTNGLVSLTDKRRVFLQFKPGAKKEYETACRRIVCIG